MKDITVGGLVGKEFDNIVGQGSIRDSIYLIKPPDAKYSKGLIYTLDINPSNFDTTGSNGRAVINKIIFTFKFL